MPSGHTGNSPNGAGASNAFDPLSGSRTSQRPTAQPKEYEKKEATYLKSELSDSVISFSSIYYFGPDWSERYWHWITPGSLFGVLLWLAASACFRGYLHFFNTYDAIYGSLGAVAVLLIWLYVAGLAFLIGGEINAEIERAQGDL